MKNATNWFTGKRKMPGRVWLCFRLKATIAGFITMTVLALCGCGDAPSLGELDRKDPEEFAEYLVAEFAKGNFRFYEKYASPERKENLDKEAAMVRDRWREGSSQVKTSLPPSFRTILSPTSLLCRFQRPHQYGCLARSQRLFSDYPEALSGLRAHRPIPFRNESKNMPIFSLPFQDNYIQAMET